MAHWEHRFRVIYATLGRFYQQHWLVRWTLANIIGWSTGLLLAALLLTQWGILGALIGGAAASILVGITQAWAFQTHPDWRHNLRGWVLWTIGGGAAATVPIYLLVFGLLFNFNLTLVLMGAVFGAIQSSVQARLLWHSVYERALWWVLASTLAGALCAPLSLSASVLSLPVCFSPGPLLFGLMTGMAVLKMTPDDDALSDASEDA